MEQDDFFYFGKILGTFGNKGHLTVFLDVDEPANYKKLESVYIDLDPERVPFFIASIELKPKKKAVIRFEDVHSLQDAEPYCGRKLYLPVSMLPKLRGKKFYHHEVIGFRVDDAEHGDIGTVESILEMPTQSLFQIRHGSKEILVPVTDGIIAKVDRRNHVIHIVAPPGLIELYL